MGVRVGFLRYALGLLALLVVGGATASAQTLADEAVTMSVEATTAGAEPGTAAVFTVRLSEPVDSAVSARLSTEPDDGADPATAGADYVPADEVHVQLPKGETARKVEVKVVDDQLDEARETFRVVLSASVAQGIRIDPTKRTATGAIQDNDDPPAAKVANAPDVTEGNSGSAAANFTVSCRRRAAARRASRSPPVTARRRRARTTSPERACSGSRRATSPAPCVSTSPATRRWRARSPSRSSSRATTRPR